MICSKTSNKHIISIESIESIEINLFHDTASPTDMTCMQLAVGNPTRLKMLQATIKRMCCAFK